MSGAPNAQRAQWSSRFAFILAATGSAVGLGNIWKFPYITGVNGGGAFVLAYLACIVGVGLPIFLAELYIGRTSQKNAVSAFEALDRPGSPWRHVGLMGVVSAFLILAFYSVVGGWVLSFLAKAFMNQFAGHTDQEIEGYLGSLFADPKALIVWHSVFMCLTVGIVIGGVKNGIEKWNNILMPALFGLMVLLLVRVFFLDGFGEALAFLFAPDFSKLNASSVLEAVGHSFFTLSLGMGAIITYGSYLKKDENIISTAFTVALMDTVVALLAGLVIFSVVFSYDLEAAAGPTLMFQTLPVLFSKMTGGYFVAILFFLLVGFAAFTSAVSLLEVVVAYFDETYDMDRRKTTLWMGGLIYVLGIVCALSFNVLSDFKIFSLNMFDLFDTVTSKFALPFGGLAISLFYGWVLGPKAMAATLGEGSSSQFQTGLLWLSRVVAPVAIAIVLVNMIFGS